MFDNKLVADNMGILEDFETFLAEKSIKSEQDITVKDVQEYVIVKREQVEDISHIINILNEYFFAVKNDFLCNELWLLLDAIGILKKMSELTKSELGEDVWQQVFGDIQMPKVGWSLDEITDFTRQMHKRLCNVVAQEQIENMYQKNAHAYQQSFDGTLREILESKGIDGLLKHLHDDFIKGIEEHCDNGDYNGFIVDDEVINFYKENPLSYRIDNKIIMRQEPVFTKQYLHEADEKLKRYYTCHCPIKKRSILQNNSGLSHTLCYCCFGHNKQQLEAAFGRKLSGMVVKTVMDQGCLECIFEIDIPKEYYSNEIKKSTTPP
jgi:hypothetical protein